MEKKMKLIYSILVLFMLCGTSFAASATQPLDGNGKIVMPQYQGCSYAMVTSSVTATVIASGAYELCGVAVSSGSAGDYVVIADSATATGITTSYATRLLIPWVYTNATSAQMAREEFVSFPVITIYGITAINSAANLRTVVYYRKR